MLFRSYAAHIKNTLDASAINVMRSKAAKAVEKSAKQAANGNGNGNGVAGQPKPDTKPTRAEKAARKEKVRDAVRVPTVDLAPGDLTSESNA